MQKLSRNRTLEGTLAVDRELMFDVNGNLVKRCSDESAGHNDICNNRSSD